ncbi:MAG: hypothetical protein ACI9QL_004280 [Candidatus Omnitrophota bacterium]|jgi:hypothetical protein
MNTDFSIYSPAMVAFGSLICIEDRFEKRCDHVSDVRTFQGLSDLSGLRELRVYVVS